MAINLSKEQVHELLKTGFNAIPIFSEFLADLETPVSLYLKLKVQNGHLHYAAKKEPEMLPGLL